MRAESARMCRFSMVQLWVASGPAGCCLSHALFAARPLLQFFAGKLIRSGEVFTLLVGFAAGVSLNPIASIKKIANQCCQLVACRCLMIMAFDFNVYGRSECRSRPTPALAPCLYPPTCLERDVHFHTRSGLQISDASGFTVFPQG